MDLIGRASGLVWPRVADVTSDRERQGTSGELVLGLDVMSPDGRLLITKMDEHLREKSTLDPGSKRASLLRTTPQTTLCATPVEGPTSAPGATSYERAGAGTRDAIPILHAHEERTGIPASAARVLRLLGDPVFERRARHPD